MKRKMTKTTKTQEKSSDDLNPVFVKCLTEMKQKAAEQKKSFGFLEKALTSIRRCSYRMGSAEECMNLQHCGKKICELLKNKLDELKTTNNLDDLDEEDEATGGKRAKLGHDEAAPNGKVSKNGLNNLGVSPDAYIILSAMYHTQEEDEDYPGYLLKEDIVLEAQKYLDYLIKSNADKGYSFDSALSTLVDKKYVVQKTPANKESYALTDSGTEFVASSLSQNPANPLFEKWLSEMKQHSKGLMKLKYTEALSSLRKCPVQLESGKDCFMLKQFGQKLCSILDIKLDHYNKKNKLTSQPSNNQEKAIQDNEPADNDLPAGEVPDQIKKSRGRGAKK